MFRVAWLNQCFQRCLEDDDLQRNFGLVSDGLAELIVGSYDSRTKQAALFSLLGPAFVLKHFSKDDTQKLDHSDNFPHTTTEAAQSQIKQDLENLSALAATRFFPVGPARDELREKMRRKVSESLQWAIYRDQEDSTASTSLTLGQEEDWDEIETVLGKSLAAIIEIDEEKLFNQNLMELARETFRANFLVLPQHLRRQLWSDQLRKHSSKVLDPPDFSSGLEQSFPEKIKLGKLAVIGMFDMFRCWPSLSQYEDRGGEFQLVLTRIVSLYPEDQLTNSTVFWVVPLLSTLAPDLSAEERKDIEEISGQVYILVETMKLGRAEIFDLVDEVYDDLAEEDPDYLFHLKDISADVYHVDLADIDPNLLCRDKEECSRVVRSLKNKKGATSDVVVSVFNDGGKYFVRQWLENGFVNILSKNCLLYVWDLLFLHSWSKRTLKVVVTAILMLIRFWMLRGSGFRTMRNIFLREPLLIYLLDLKKTIQHLSKEGKIQDCPKSSNWVGKVVAPPKPFWQELKIGKAAVVQSLSNKPISFHNLTGAITSKFQRKDSEDSLSSLEEVEQEPWLSLWQPYNTNYDQSVPDKLPKLSGTFDLYVDGIRFLPETILLARITGGILNPLMDLGGEKTSFTEVEINAYPSLNSKARSPTFHFKVRINEEKAMLNPHALLHLEIVGFEEQTERTVTVGSAVLNIFQNTKGSPINAGGHQLQVRRGQVGAEDTLRDHGEFDVVPCCSVLVRLTPVKEKFVSAPAYSNGYYHSDSTRPGVTAAAFYKTYYQDEGFSKHSVKSNIEKVMKSSDGTNDDLESFMKQALSTAENDSALLDASRFHRLTCEAGIRLCLEAVFGLPAKWERKYYQALVEVVDLNDPTGSFGKCLSQNFLMESKVRSAVWRDLSHPLSIPASGNRVIVVKLYSVKPEYRASWEKEPAGKLTGSLKIKFDSPDAWTLCDLSSGHHYLPLFRGDLPGCLQHLQTAGYTRETFKDFVDKNEKSIKQISSERGNSVVVVKVMDGHFDDQTWWPRSSAEEPFHHYQSLQLFGGKDAACLEPGTSGRAWQDFILDSLPEKIRKKREKSKKYKENEAKFLDLIQRRFLKELNIAIVHSDSGATVVTSSNLPKINTQ